MPNLVPIQFLALFGFAILRLVVGLVWCHLALRHYTERDRVLTHIRIPFFPYPKVVLSIIVLGEIVAGVLFILGFLTQVAALITFLWCLRFFVLGRYLTDESFPRGLTLLLLATISVTLFITGAGALAFDLPI